MPEIQVTGREGWIKLNSSSDLPYSVAPGLSYRRFAKIRHDMMAAGEQDPIVPEVPSPPQGSATSDGQGGDQHGPSHTSTPGNFHSECSSLCSSSFVTCLDYFFFSERAFAGVAHILD